MQGVCSCRFAGLPGIVAFDLDNFLSMAQRSRKWQDPHTLKNVTIKQLQLDSWMQPVITCLQVKVSTQPSQCHCDCMAAVHACSGMHLNLDLGLMLICS